MAQNIWLTFSPFGRLFYGCVSERNKSASIAQLWGLLCWRGGEWLSMLLRSWIDRVGEWVVSLDTIGQMSSSAKGN